MYSLKPTLVAPIATHPVHQRYVYGCSAQIVTGFPDTKPINWPVPPIH